MPHYLGIIFALIALFSWGFGDFFIQKTTRAVGSWKALFCIGFLGFVVLLPFVKNEIFSLTINNLLLLVLLTVVIVFAALFDFEALRLGKIAVVEPIIGLELPLTVGLSVVLGGESLTLLQIFLIILVFLGIVLAITKHHTHLHYHKRIFEKGVILAGVGAIGLASTNFMVGVSSRSISPLMTIWFTHSMVALISLIYLISTGRVKGLIADVKNHTLSIVAQSVFDNAAWIAFAFSATLIETSIAATISESYIALAALLGILVGREKLKRHQILGIVLAVIGVVSLAYVS